MFAEDLTTRNKDRWYIHRSAGQIKIGPLYANQIREGLREGLIDPFDLVSREGEREYKKIIEEEGLFRSIQDLEPGPGFDFSIRDSEAAPESFDTPERPLQNQPFLSTSVSHLKVLRSPKLLTESQELRKKSYIQPTRQEKKPELSHKNSDRRHNQHQFTASTPELPRHYYLRTPTGIKSRRCSVTEICEFFHSQNYCSDCTVHRKGVNGHIRLGTFMQLISGTRRSGQSPVQDMNYLIRMKKNQKINTESIGILIDTYTNPYHAESKLSAYLILFTIGLILSGIACYYTFA